MALAKVLVVTALLVTRPESSFAQAEVPATPACWASLPVVDTVRVLFEVHTEEHKIWQGTNLAGLSTDYLTSVATAIAKHVRIPAQTDSRAFGVTRRKDSSPNLVGARLRHAVVTYRPLPDGRIASVRLYGVGVSPAMERALSQAVIEADGAGAIPPLPPGQYPPNMAIEVTLAPRQTATSSDTMHLVPAHAGASRPVAVASADVELYRLDSAVEPIRATQRVRYPEAARRANARDVVTMEFLVDATGRVEMNSAILRSANHVEFVDAVAKALPQMRFKPAKSGACLLPVVVRQSFAFTMPR